MRREVTDFIAVAERSEKGFAICRPLLSATNWRELACTAMLSGAAITYGSAATEYTVQSRFRLETISLHLHLRYIRSSACA